ncbi:esterase/lipase family protein [Acidovorax kalamii]|uniref:esterase/lipase family protein n=1 Tax=Acidovorax kalamii TaxID=2004485 RepID=UPI0020919E10|nr:alpha/beta hydrolase [Acidovorax kalamii]MCO5358488.1 alpha/beta hydrolase [Acidovorax kalamii]
MPSLRPPRTPNSVPASGSNPLRQLRASDLRGVARLAAQATTGISRVAEGVHQSVRGTLGLPGGAQPGRTGGLTGLVYQSIRGVTQLVDAGLQAGLARLEPFFSAGTPGTEVQWEREAVLAALNGVMGDRLQQDNNPLCTRMGWYQQGLPLDVRALGAAGTATGKLLVLVHGLCMNDLQWQHVGHDHGTHLAQALGYTPVYLRYNTGQHVSTNGAELSALLESLVASWPVPVTELAVLAHSMGGLVVRSACHHAATLAAAPSGWLPRLRQVAFLGTPHHGAPLERAGSWVDVLLGSTPYSRPFARLAQLRSAGITDLRYGHVLDTDWQGRDRFRTRPDQRTPVPLPAGVACYAVAATLAARRSPVAERLVGDGLVPLHSALGIHDDAGRGLGFAKERQAVFHRLGHLALLGDAGVARQLEQWMAAPT